MPRPCHADHPPSPEVCLLCRLYQSRADYRALWDAPGAGLPAAPRCRHLGGETGATTPCPSCRGQVRLKLFACAAHGRCTPCRPAPGIACCVGCPNHEAAE